MKKFLSLLLMAMVLLIPFSVKAQTTLNYTTQKNADGTITVTVTYNTTDNLESMTVTVTEFGGAQVTEVNNASNSDWTVNSREESNNVWTVVLSSPGVSGEGDLFTYTYTPSGTEDCKTQISFGSASTTVTPPSTPSTDKPTDNKQTGATLPYIALGLIAAGAVSAYLVTRNKTKMYKI